MFFLDPIPKIYCMPWQMAGAAIGAIGNLIGNNQVAKANQRLQRESQDWQTKERLASQQFHSDTRIASQKYQTAEREAQNQWSENMYNQYSSPQAMLEQYEAAGLNGRLAADSGSVGSVTSGSGSSGGAPSGSAPGTPSGPTPPYKPYNSLGSSFADMAGAMAQLAQAKKTGVDTRLLEEEFNDLVAEQHWNAETAKFGRLFLQPQIWKKNKAEIQSILADVENKTATYEEIKKRIDGLKIDNDTKKKILDHWDEMYEQDSELKDAEIRSTNAEAQNREDQHELFPSAKANLVKTNAFLDQQIKEKKISNEVAEKTKSYLVKSAQALASRGSHEAVLAYQKAMEQTISNYIYRNTGMKDLSSQPNVFKTLYLLNKDTDKSKPLESFVEDQYKAFGFKSADEFATFLENID